VLTRACVALLFFLGLAGRAESFQISVDVNLVVLQATVHDRDGHVVSDLRERDFEVYEDGVRQSVQVFRHEDVPVTVGLIVDHSGSMRTKLTEVIEAARIFVRSSNPGDQMFVVNFNEKVTAGLPGAMRLTNHIYDLERAIWATPAAGQTALYDAVIDGLERARADGPEKKVLVVISDGGDNASARGLAEVLQKAGESSALVYTIGIFDEDDPDRNPKMLRRLAGATGGEAFFPGQLSEITAICERIARDIRSQYTLAYVSSAPARPGAVRTVRMVAHGEGNRTLLVRTRSSYIAR
jgi:VWFA-related protein